MSLLVAGETEVRFELKVWVLPKKISVWLLF